MAPHEEKAKEIVKKYGKKNALLFVDDLIEIIESMTYETIDDVVKFNYLFYTEVKLEIEKFP